MFVNYEYLNEYIFLNYSCEYIHGDVCDMCGLQALHPTDQQQRKGILLGCLYL